jgi:alpha-mannosidase
MKTIHIIPNAHIDPVWLWPWQAGLDAALATCRSACERLERHPDLTFCQGEAWVYREIQRCDPELFKRISGHIASGRWSLVGGWWIQPDCNGPSGWAMRKQIAIGLRYFQDTFQVHPRTAYNIDSFGHAATLPSLMREMRQDRYVMMRPQEHEMQLPARVFRWREKVGSPEVTVFRIAGSYNGGGDVEHIRHCLHGLPAGLEHTMCYFGVGDHGGGPTEAQLARVRSLGGTLDGWKIEFSTPDRFFDAVAASGVALPVVTGELQHHAIGCFGVHREVKTGVRRAEHLLAQAEFVAAKSPDPQDTSRMAEAWELVAFNHFHDTYGGTCIPSANEQARSQLGMAIAIADDVAQRALRRLATQIPADPRQGLLLFNASDTAFSGPVDIEPWVDWQNTSGWRLLDEQNQVVPSQQVETECQVNGLRRFHLHLDAQPGQLRVLRLDTTGAGAVLAPAQGLAVSASATAITAAHTEVVLGAKPELRLSQLRMPLPDLELYEDPTDTWSHGIDRYAETAVATPVWDAAVSVDAGPWLGSLVRSGTIGSSRILAEWRVHALEPFAELRLRVLWTERRRLLKLRISLPGGPLEREDGILGGALTRRNDGRELPLRDRSLFSTGQGALGVVAPDCFALDATPERARFTLLRSPAFAHHDPHPGTSPRARFTDQGEHEFRFRFFGGTPLDREILDRHAAMMQRPLLFAEVTKGMLARL